MKVINQAYLQQAAYFRFLKERGYSERMIHALDAIAAIKASVYGPDRKHPSMDQIALSRQIEIVDCLPAPNWADEEIVEALAAGVSREELQRQADQDREMLVNQAYWIVLAAENGLKN